MMLAKKIWTGLGHLMDAETAHNMAVYSISKLPESKLKCFTFETLKTNSMGLDFMNPIGLAAGFDKNGYCFRQIPRFGFGHVEIGTLTPQPQRGQKKPRIFRLPKAHGIINRMGFPNEGMDAIEPRLSKNKPAILGINIGCNSDSRERIKDYEQIIRKIGRYGDYFTMNVSSPNTKGLRLLQSEDQLKRLFEVARKAFSDIGVAHKPLLVKLAPDIEDLENIAKTLLAVKPDGVIVSNTTIDRLEHIKHCTHAHQAGGLSGAPLFKPSTILLAKLYRLCRGELTFIGVGGVETAE
ncbi:MAG: quinone-dependent dihydroorotate dehydrogenase, partial [Pseudomonadota bacterium]